MEGHPTETQVFVHTATPLPKMESKNSTILLQGKARGKGQGLRQRTKPTPCQEIMEWPDVPEMAAYGELLQLLNAELNEDTIREMVKDFPIIDPLQVPVEDTHSPVVDLNNIVDPEAKAQEAVEPLTQTLTKVFLYSRAKLQQSLFT